MAIELQLGLALIPTNPTKAFDLNNAHVIHDTVPCLDFNSACRKKRPLDSDPSSAFRRTLPLLLWNDHPNDGDDDPTDPHSASNDSYAHATHFLIFYFEFGWFVRLNFFGWFHRDDEEQENNGLVGWPPLKRRRKGIFMQKRGGRGRAAVMRRPAVENGGGVFRGLNSNSRYVKVKMEGVGIARKVDLSQHHSFDTLRATLMNMFGEFVFLSRLRIVNPGLMRVCVLILGLFGNRWNGFRRLQTHLPGRRRWLVTCWGRNLEVKLNTHRNNK